MRREIGSMIVTGAILLTLPVNAEAAPPCTIPGSPGPDVLRGTKGSDFICAGSGSDKVFGRGGADILKGGLGNDTLVGGPGPDRLMGGAGRDSCRDRNATTYVRGCEQRPHNRLRPRGGGFSCCPVLPEPRDITAPEVLGVLFTKPYVDTSSESSIDLWVEARDLQSGIGHVEVELEGPNGPWRDVAFEGDSLYGGALAFIEVPPSTSPGKYRVASLILVDRSGNRVSFDTAKLAKAGFDAAFDVFEGPDSHGPELAGYSYTPETLDTSTGPGAVQFSLTAKDELSGVKDVAALIRLPGSAPPLCYPCGARASSDLASGTIYDGTWEEEFPLAQFAMSGTYIVSAVVLYDRAGNQTDYNREELEDLGYPVEFTQTGAGDTEPPQIVDFWMNPGTLQSSSGKGAIQFFVHVTDNLSGVGESSDSVLEGMRVDIEPPFAFEWGLTDGGVSQVSGTEFDGVWRFEKILPPDAETGMWSIPAIEATDHAGNETLLRGAELKGLGWDLTFQNLP